MEPKIALNKPLKRQDYFIILANLIPIYGVWFEGWTAKEVFIAYALETLIVGIITVLKMLIRTIVVGSDLWYNREATTRVSGLFFICFFIFHYGLFAAVQTGIFAGAAGLDSGGGFFSFFINWYKFLTEDSWLMVLAFFASYFLRDLVPFIARKQYKEVSMMRLMFQPYGRIFIQQFIVIIGSMFVTFGFDKGFVLVFALVKIFFEVYVNFEEILNKSFKDMEGQTSGKQ